MNINGAWCFVQDEDVITMEGCNVCQSLGKIRVENLVKIILVSF